MRGQDSLPRPQLQPGLRLPGAGSEADAIHPRGLPAGDRGPSDRSFGLILSGFLLVVALWPLARGGSVRVWALGLATAFLVAAAARPRVLHPANWLWTWLGLLAHQAVSLLVLTALFYLVITPMGLVLRALGKDLLRLNFDPNAPSYWIERRPPGPMPGTMPNQF